MKNKNAANLLISRYKEEIIDKVKSNREVIIVGQTGSGKSTQVPQYLHEARDQIGLTVHQKIACLHPRSVAATTIAERVAFETNTELGSVVGYRVRFYTVCDKTAPIEFMTAGFMSRLLSTPAEIGRYGVVIVDEAHERSVQIDLVLGQMRWLMSRDEGKNVRLVVMSATLDEAETQLYYPEAAVVRIPHRPDRVDVIYRTVKGADYVAEAAKVVSEVLGGKGGGHVLVFLPSEEKVMRCCKRIKNDAKKPKPVVLPFFGAMDKEDKARVFSEFSGRRKVVVATNIAETSLTIAGVTVVVDTGLVKRVRYDEKKQVEHWVTERISAAEAEQRRGRTGRTGKGRCLCYRLYEAFEGYGQRLVRPGVDLAILEGRFSLGELRVLAGSLEMLQEAQDWSQFETMAVEILSGTTPDAKWVCRRYQEPEMLLANPDYLVLTLKALKVDMATFPFVVRPNPESLDAAVMRLTDLGLLHEGGPGLTPLGKKCVRLPLSPALAKVAVLAANTEAREDVLIAVSMLQGTASLTRSASLPAVSLLGDLHTLVLLFEEAELHRFSPGWCKATGVSESALRFSSLVLAQLLYLMPSPYGVSSRSRFEAGVRYEKMREAFLAGFYGNIAVRTTEGHYELSGGRKAHLYQHCCVDRHEPIVLSLSLRSSMSEKSVTMKDCVVLDLDFLEGIDPRKWRIKTRMWQKVLRLVRGEQPS